MGARREEMLTLRTAGSDFYRCSFPGLSWPVCKMKALVSSPAQLRCSVVADISLFSSPHQKCFHSLQTCMLTGIHLELPCGGRLGTLGTRWAWFLPPWILQHRGDDRAFHHYRGKGTFVKRNAGGTRKPLRLLLTPLCF